MKSGGRGKWVWGSLAVVPNIAEVTVTGVIQVPDGTKEKSYQFPGLPAGRGGGGKSGGQPAGWGS